MSSPGRRGIEQREQAGREELEAALADAGLSSGNIEQLSPYIEYYAENRIFPFIRNAFLLFAAVAVIAWFVVPVAGMAVGVVAVLVGIAVAYQYPHYRRSNQLKEELVTSPGKFFDGDHDWEHLEEKYD